jgi:methionine-rich copper-binding protein CopC
MSVALIMAVAPRSAAAHAEPERASPPINGVVPAAPAVVEIWFDEEVATEGTAIQVIGPGGIQVDLGDAAVDLFDPERRHVTVSLREGLGPGAYTVQWQSASNADGDSAQGGYLFSVEPGASPVASPAAALAPSPAATSTAEPTPVPAVSATGNFDARAFWISVGAGLLAALAIFAFWRLVRPKQPLVKG